MVDSKGFAKQLYDSTDRIEYLDIMKGIGIILLLLSHSIAWESSVKTWIFSFHMPLFFSCTGMLICEKYPTPKKMRGKMREFAARKFFSIMVPCIIFSVMILIFKIGLKYIGNGEFHWDDLTDGALSIVQLRGVESLWFLPCLLIAELAYMLIYVYCPIWTRHLCGLVALCIMIFFANELPLGIEGTFIRASAGVVFIHLGYIMHHLKTQPIWLCLVGLLIGILMSYLNGFAAIGSFEYKSVLLYVVGAFCSLTAIASLCKRISRMQIIPYLGENSIVVLCTNNILIELLRLVDYKLTDNYFLTHGMIGCILFAALLTVIELAVIKVGMKWFSVLFGKRKKNKTHKGIEYIVALYGNGSAGNHGCEAIVRGTVAVLGEENQYIVQSPQPEDDFRYGLQELAQIHPAVSPIKKDLRFLAAYLKMKTSKVYTDMDGLGYVPGIKRAAQAAKIALSVGGDNYCYPGTEIYSWLNREYRKNGMKTVLWGCSVEPEIVAKPEVTKDLASYDLIVARESISYEAIRKVQKNTVLAPDPAFFMEVRACPMDERMKSGNVIGINISPMIISAEKTAGMAYENYKNLISYILENTDAYIALIPHVVWTSNDDRTVLRRLYEDFDRDPRLILVEDHTAPELKYIISHCRMFIGARTHATIAAYSSCVPTLVVGYSVKARGIARDLFGTEENYVLPVQQLSEPDQLVLRYKYLAANENQIRTHLKRFMLEYRRNVCTFEIIKEKVSL